MKSNQKFIAVNIAALLGLFVVSNVDAAVLCAKKNGAVFQRNACKSNETQVQGTPGPIGPAGPQGQAGQSGVNNSPCTQADIVDGAWTMTMFNSTEANNCGIAFDANGNFQSGSFCYQASNGMQQQVSITGGAMKLAAAQACAFSLTAVKSTGDSWAGTVVLDRTRSVFLGLGGKLVSQNMVKEQTTITGSRWGVQGSTNGVQTLSYPQDFNDMLNEAGSGLMIIPEEN